MNKLSTTSKFVSAGAILALGMGVSAAVMTSSANADETHAIPKIAHISQSASVIPPAVLPSSIKAPSISGIGAGDDSEGSSLGNSSEDSEEGSGVSTNAPSSLSTGASISAPSGLSGNVSTSASDDASENGSDD